MARRAPRPQPMDGWNAADLVAGGRGALANGEWDRASELFERAVELDGGPDALDGLSRALLFREDLGRAIELKERAFAAYRAAGAAPEAAEVARWLAFLHGSVHGNMAAAKGWMARAERLIDGIDECAAHGWMALDRAPFSDDPAEREQLALAALAIARRFGDLDLEFSAMALLGEARVAAGRIDDGMRLLDETMAAVTGGEISKVEAVGEIYCRLLGACERVADVRRAEQWLDAASRSVAWVGFVPPTCRSHYGGILIAIGRWQEAESELLAAIRTFEGGYRAARLGPLIRLAELRARQGRFEEAQRLVEEIDWHPAASRVLATVALRQGEAELAEERARRCLEANGPDDPSCAGALGLLAESQLARGRLEPAKATAARLDRLAAATGDERARATTDLTLGAIAAAEADESARTHLRAALERFSALQLPLESGRARLELADALASTAPAAAREEARLALGTFERLGATPDADRCGALLRRLGAAGRPRRKAVGALTARETEVLSLLAEGCSNADIAARLYISRRTAEHHVASILSKLGLHRRAEAAAHAIRNRQVP